MKQSQEDRVINWLATGRTLTPLQALRKFGTLRLGARVFSLRQQGHNIKSDMVRRNGATVARYRLDP